MIVLGAFVDVSVGKVRKGKLRKKDSVRVLFLNYLLSFPYTQTSTNMVFLVPLMAHPNIQKKVISKDLLSESLSYVFY